MTDGWHNDTSADANDSNRSTPATPQDRQSLPEGIPVARPITLTHAMPLISMPPTLAPGREMLLLDAKVSTAWQDLGLLFVGLVVAVVLAEVAALWLLPKLVLDGPDAADLSVEQLAHMFGVPAVALRGVAWILLVALIVRFRRQSGRSVGITRRLWGLAALLGVGACIVAWGLGIGWSLLAFMIWPNLFEDMNANVERLMEMLPRMHPLVFGLVALMVAIYEELVFRGFLMTRLRRGTGSWVVAVLVSSAIFTSLHAFDQELVALPLIGILSLVFSIVTIWRRSLIPAIVGHWIYNWVTFLWIYIQFGDRWNP